MFPALGLTLALMTPGAPIPKDVTPGGPAPYILNLKSDSDGKIRFQVMRGEKVKVSTVTFQGGPNGQQVPVTVEREETVMKYLRVELAELKGLKVYSTDGKEVDIKDAAKKLGESAMAIASVNGQKVDSAFLKLFKDDVLILVSSDLTPNGGGFGGNIGFPGVMPAFPVPGIQILPAPPLPPVQIAPPIQVVPQVAPALPPMLQKAVPEKD
jgi:hypothetical protein